MLVDEVLERRGLCLRPRRFRDAMLVGVVQYFSCASCAAFTVISGGRRLSVTRLPRPYWTMNDFTPDGCTRSNSPG